MMLSLCRSVALLSVVFASQVFAVDGTITFTGQVVESPCETTTDAPQQRLEMRCQRAGETTVNTWSLASLTGTGVRSSLASMEIRYLDPQRKLGILTVSYK